MSSTKAQIRLIFVNRFYAPDLSATSQILTDVAEALAERGVPVTVYTSRLSYRGGDWFARSETRNGVKIRRIWTTNFGRGALLGRALDYLSFYVSMFLTLLVVVSKDDVLIVKTDPPMLSVPLGLVVRLKGARWGNWLQDIYPEVAIALGVGKDNNLLMRGLKALRNRSLKKADANIVIGARMRDRVLEFGVSSDCIIQIENFVDDEQIVELPDHALALRKEWGFENDDFIIGYSGNLGRAHDLDTILDAASQLSQHPKIKFLFVGGGHLHDRLTQEIEARGLSNTVLKPYQPRARLPESLRLPNVHWASLLPALEGYIVPSKAYGIAAAGRPLLMIGAPDGELGQLVADHGFGTCFEPGQSQAVADFIVSLANDQAEVAKLGRAARIYIDGFASRVRTFDRWHDLYKRLSRRD